MWQIIGQEKITSLLQRSLERGLLAHAYLMVGPTHVGKMTLAVSLAQAVNCEASARPCGQCVSCQKIALGKHADVRVIGLNGSGDTAKPQTEISIEQIRDAQHASSLPPFEGRCRVFIIDGAESMSNEAANCLLKTLEEPAAKVIFILLTTNEKLLLPTVVSRCQRLELPPIPVAEVEEVLNQRGTESKKAKLLARLSHGCPGWAVLAALDDSPLQERAQKLEHILEAINGDYEARFAYSARLAAQFGQSKEDVYGTLDLWLDWWRDLLLVKAGIAGQITNIDFESSLVEISENFNLEEIKTVINSIRSARGQLRQNASPQLVLDVLMLNIPRRKHG